MKRHGLVDQNMWRRKTYQNMNFLQGGKLAQFAHHHPKSTLINSLVIHREFAQQIGKSMFAFCLSNNHLQ